MKRKKKFQILLLLLTCACISVFIVFLSDIEGHITGYISEIHKQFYAVDYIKITDWKRLEYKTCNGNFIGYGHQFAILKNVILTPKSNKFYIACGQKLPKYHFNYGGEGTHLNRWMGLIESLDRLSAETPVIQGAKHVFKDKLVVAVLRYEYANLYHTLTDWYNIFIVARLLDESIDKVTIILFDENVKGHLDEAWMTLFKNVTVRKNMSQTVLYSKMVWAVLGYESPVNFHATNTLPFVQDFYEFILRRHGIQETKMLNCLSPIITFIWRRDYVAHPGNPTGLVSRKVKNEEELISHIQEFFPKALVQGVQLDKLSFKQQLDVIVDTDILISMHGAGLTHILFLPHHAGVVELFPLYWKKYFGASHFRAMAKWRKLKYSAWQNLNPSNEFDHLYTYIPPVSLESHVSPIYKQICPVR